MKYLTSFLLYFFIVKASLGQSDSTKLIFGKYEGIQVKFYKLPTDTSDRVERMNKVWGTKTLILDINGRFSLEFPVPYPTTRIYPRRFTKGNWTRVRDTLILNTLYLYSDFIKVKERETGDNHIQVSVRYQDQRKYYPDMDVIINGETRATAGKSWVYFPLDSIKIMEIKRYAGPTSYEREWLYRPKNSRSNYFSIFVKKEIDGNNFILEDYKLLVRDSSLVQIDESFNLDVKRFDLVQ